MKQRIAESDQQYEQALLARSSYKGVDNSELLNNWEMIGQPVERTNGLRYVKWKNRTSGQIVISFAGTDSIVDVGHDISRAVTGWSSQYQDSSLVVRQAIWDYGSENILLTGHSLGGGIASSNSVFHGVPSVVYNPAGVPLLAFVGAQETSSAKELITVFKAPKDPVTGIQDSVWGSGRGVLVGLFPYLVFEPNLLPDTLGNVLSIPVVNSPFNPDPFEPHYMDSVLTALRKERQHYLNELDNFINGLEFVNRSRRARNEPPYRLPAD